MRGATPIRLIRWLAPAALAVACLAPSARGQTQPPPPIPPEQLTEACIAMQQNIENEVVGVIFEGCSRVVEILTLLGQFGAPPADIVAFGEAGHARLDAYHTAALTFLINCERDCQVLLDRYNESPNRIVPLKVAVTTAREDASAMVAGAFQQAWEKITATIARLTGSTQ